MQEGRDVWWHDCVDSQSGDLPAVPLDSEASLFILYTSGSTGKPKGIRHTLPGITSGQNGPSSGYLIIEMMIFIGALLTAAGSQDIAILFTGPLQQAPRV